MAGFTPQLTSFSRVFLIEGRARPDREPEYESCMKMAGIDAGQGDITDIECPDPGSYGEFINVGSFQGGRDRITTKLTGRYAADVLSTLFRLAKQRCSHDIQLHFGKCKDPRDFDTGFTKALILEDARLPSYSTDELGALSSDENAPVNEGVDVSAMEAYEVVPLVWSEEGKVAVVNPLVDVTYCDYKRCGDCEDPSEGCDVAYAVGSSGAGSPGTAPDLDYTFDGGKTWAANDINSLLSTENAIGVGCVDTYVVVISNDALSLHYKAKSLVSTAGGWVKITTGFVAGGAPNDIWSLGDFAFIVGAGGYVYKCTDPGAGVTVIDAGTATTNDLLAVHAISDEQAVAVGNTDTVIHTDNGVDWRTTAATPGSGANLTCVWMLADDVWLVGTSNGRIYYTLNHGVAWTRLTLPIAVTSVNDIAFSTASVGYAACTRPGPQGIIMRTFDAGYSWKVVPETTGNLPANDAIAAIAACSYSANHAIGVGTGDNALDGIIIAGMPD